MNLCSSCGKDFVSVWAFDKHHPISRIRWAKKCLSTKEMLSKGFRITRAGKWAYGEAKNRFWEKKEIGDDQQ